jgi:Lactonase, 7-bladed beta-propeller
MLDIGRRITYLGSLTLLFLVACHSDGGSGPPSSSNSEKIVVTPSVSGTVTAKSGATETLGIPFNASAAGALSNLIVTGLGSLPAGWSAPTAFTCATVSTGNGCILSMTFAPLGASSGTITLAYTYSEGSGAAQSGSLAIPFSSTTNDNVVASASPSGQVAVATPSGSQSVAVSFVTDDGNPATSLTLITALSALPPGWSSTATSFGCPAVSTGNGCQLPLTYAPGAFGSGTLTLTFSYLDDSGTSKSGTLNIPYSATTNNNVVAATAPTGQVNAVVAAGNQAVVVTFTTDEGPVTAFAVTTSLASLPAGWASNVSTLTCASVSSGNGCQLTLGYTPVAVGTGTLQIAYGYQSDSGVAKTGSVSIPYASTAHDNVTGSVAPSGQITAVANSGSQAVQVTFGTDDGNVASALSLTSPLNALPAGWSSTAQSFSCANVSSGSGCQLGLVYTPGAVDVGTLTLAFSYADNAGTQRTGTVNIPYATTTDDNVTGTVAPSGTLNVLLNTSQSVSITFVTDDTLTATNLSIAPAVFSSLPAGWSSGTSSFTCATVSTGSGCQLALTLDPTVVGSGSVSLPYSYTDNSGSAKTGTMNIPYVGSVHNNAVGVVSPSGTISGALGASQSVTVTFNTDDANPAASLSVTSGLGTLPSGWSSSSGTFSCASVLAAGAACQLTLTYLPTSVGGGTVTLNFGYNDNFGTAKTGTIAIAYASANPHAYIADPNASPFLCSINSDSTLSGCTAMGLASNIWDLAFNGDTVYMSNLSANNISICSVAADGTFSNCTTGGSNMNAPSQLAIQGSYLYVTNAGGGTGVTVCSIDPSSGALSNCTLTSSVGPTRGIAAVGNYAYAGSNQGGSTIDVCALDATTGLLSNCVASSQSAWYWLTAANGYLYTSQGAGVGVCPILAGGGIPTCATSTIAAGISQVWAVTISGSNAYVTTQTTGTFPIFITTFNVFLCSVSPLNGSLSSCALSNGGAYPYFLLHVLIH